MRAGTEIEKKRTAIEGAAASLIDRVTSLIQAVDVSPPAGLTTIRTALRASTDERRANDMFKIVICGRFRNGKSTFVNALLGQATSSVDLPENELGPMPTEDGIPTTATITQVRFSEEPYVIAHRFDNTTEEWGFQRYLRDARLWAGARDNSRSFDDIMMFEVGYPAELLRSGVSLIDSPGMDENPRRTETTRQILRDADAAIIVYRSDSFAGETEQSFAAEVTSYSGKIFSVINRFNNRAIDAPFRAMAAHRLGLDPESQKSFIEDPRNIDVYGVDARMALNASVCNDAERLANSGMAEFERRISQFLIEDRYPAQAERILKTIDQDFRVVEHSLAQRIAVLGAERTHLETVLSDCDIRLDKIEQRVKNIGVIVDRAGRRIERAAVDSFRHLIVDISEDLPRVFAETPIASLKDVGDKVQALVRRKFVDDAVEVLNNIVLQRIRSWAEEPTAPGSLANNIQPILAELRDDVAAEIRMIDDELSGIRLEIDTLTPGVDTSKGAVVSIYERLAWTGLGLLIHDPLTAISGGAAGWRGMAGGIVSFVGVSIIAGVTAAAFGAALAPATITLIAWAGFAGGSTTTALIGIESRVRKQALTIYQPKLRALRHERSAEVQITVQIDKAFAAMKKDIAAVVQGALGDERRNIEELRLTKNFDHAQKEAMLADLMPTASGVKLCREQLQDLRATIKNAV